MENITFDFVINSENQIVDLSEPVVEEKELWEVGSENEADLW